MKARTAVLMFTVVTGAGALSAGVDVARAPCKPLCERQCDAAHDLCKGQADLQQSDKPLAVSAQRADGAGDVHETLAVTWRVAPSCGAAQAQCQHDAKAKRGPVLQMAHETREACTKPLAAPHRSGEARLRRDARHLPQDVQVARRGRSSKLAHGIGSGVTTGVRGPALVRPASSATLPGVCDAFVALVPVSRTAISLFAKNSDRPLECQRVVQLRAARERRRGAPALSVPGDSRPAASCPRAVRAEAPEVPLEVPDGVPAGAVVRVLELHHDLRARGFRARVVRVHVLDADVHSLLHGVPRVCRGRARAFPIRA